MPGKKEGLQSKILRPPRSFRGEYEVTERDGLPKVDIVLDGAGSL